MSSQSNILNHSELHKLTEQGVQLHRAQQEPIFFPQSLFAAGQTQQQSGQSRGRQPAITFMKSECFMFPLAMISGIFGDSPDIAFRDILGNLRFT